MDIGHLLWTLVLVSVSQSRSLVDKSHVTNSKCTGDAIIKYKLTFQTYWSEETFPKQYPHFRPNAQWSRLIGRSHGADYVLWREGDRATALVREFAENGASEALDLESQGQKGILDAFSASSIPHGVGSSAAIIMVDALHPQVSVISHIVPSPDWFVGLDSVALCRNGRWLNHLEVPLGPMDAGTDKGFTFTSPNWPDFPQQQITRMTAKFPTHPASSFYYPDSDVLPTIAKIVFSRIDQDTGSTLGVNAELQNDDHMRQEPLSSALRPRGEHHQAREHHPKAGPPDTEVENHDTLKVGRKQEQAEDESGSDRSRNLALTKKLNKKNKAKKNKKTRSRQNTNKKGPIDCQVSEWMDWGPCSKSCGFGTRSRMRRLTVPAKNGGSPCPPLLEEEMCGTMRNCGWNHFSFSNWGKNTG